MDPILELQSVIIPRLLATASITSIVGTKVFDLPPQGVAQMPYISIGPSSFDSDDADCVSGGEVMIQIDAWSKDAGRAELRRMADAIRKALGGWEPTLTTNALVTFEHWRTDYLTDGVIHHASVRFTAIIEEP